MVLSPQITPLATEQPSSLPTTNSSLPPDNKGDGGKESRILNILRVIQKRAVLYQEIF